MTVLKIKQGATYSFGFTWREVELDGDGNPVKDSDGKYVLGDPIPLTGCSAQMQVRRKIGESVLIKATSESPLTSGVLDPDKVADGAGRIFLEKNGATGHIGVTLTYEDTMKLVSKSAVFDLEVTWPLQPDEILPERRRPLEGTIEVDLNVTVDS